MLTAWVKIKNQHPKDLLVPLVGDRDEWRMLRPARDRIIQVTEARGYVRGKVVQGALSRSFGLGRAAASSKSLSAPEGVKMQMCTGGMLAVERLGGNKNIQIRYLPGQPTGTRESLSRQ